MLTHLSVRDFAIVESVELGLAAGLTVVTGETGAGKSLLVDALLLLSGGRADSTVVRSGAERAELSAGFDLSALPDVRDWLAENDLDDGEDCLLRRVVRVAGASRAWINGRQVTLQTLGDLAARLVGIHGQHEHQSLLARSSQLDLLDRHGGHGSLRAQVADAAARWQALARRCRALEQRGGADPERLDLLRHHLDELKAHALTREALAALEQEHHRLSHQGETLAACAGARDLLDGDDEGSLLAGLARARQLLDRAQAGDPALVGVLQSLATAQLELGEAVRSLDAHLDGAETDPARLARVEAQLSRLHDLARKHRVAPADLTGQRDRLAAELEDALGADQQLSELAGELSRTRGEWLALATRLSAARAAAAERLGTEVTALMAELGMAGGRFEVALEPAAAQSPEAAGLERCEFMVCANPGQAPRPLRKVASGGELSRIALAIQVATLGEDPVPTMVFDEVDSGVGGAVAEILGRKLRRLGGHAQVLCVTHLPQVAAQGQHHLSVRKLASDGQTRTQVLPLAADHRIDELARMLGGVRITPETLAHARQMLASAAP
ncbi:MAG: DNA repair protein RecN [Xanthomonadales bacterium]|nr:DNA repair protein RecN [Xanthomonadales bacterium]